MQKWALGTAGYFGSTQLPIIAQLTMDRTMRVEFFNDSGLESSHYGFGRKWFDLSHIYINDSARFEFCLNDLSHVLGFFFQSIIHAYGIMYIWNEYYFAKCWFNYSTCGQGSFALSAERFSNF